MISPTRILSEEAGAGVPVSGMTVELEAPDGVVEVVAVPEGNRWLEVVLLEGGLTGLRGRPEWAEGATVTRYGARRLDPANFRVDPFNVTLVMRVRAPRGGLEERVRRVENLFSWGVPTVLRVRSPHGGERAFELVDAVFEDWPSSLAGMMSVEVSVNARCLQGHGWGVAEEFTGVVKVVPGGDRPMAPRCRLLWDGRATSVTLPSGQVVALAAADGPRIVDLDRGMMGQVTYPDGEVDTVVWSRLQGMLPGVALTPGVESAWSLGAGLVLEVTPRFFSPWR